MHRLKVNGTHPPFTLARSGPAPRRILAVDNRIRFWRFPKCSTTIYFPDISCVQRPYPIFPMASASASWKTQFLSCYTIVSYFRTPGALHYIAHTVVISV